MTEKQFKELWNSFSENTKAFMRDMWDHYDYNVEKTYIHKKHRFMIRRYNTMEQMGIAVPASCAMSWSARCHGTFGSSPSGTRKSANPGTGSF